MQTGKEVSGITECTVHSKNKYEIFMLICMEILGMNVSMIQNGNSFMTNVWRLQLFCRGLSDPLHSELS